MQLNEGEIFGASIPQSFLGTGAVCDECPQEAWRTILISGGSPSRLRKIPLCRKHLNRALAEHVSLRRVERDYVLHSSPGGRSWARGHFTSTLSHVVGGVFLFLITTCATAVGSTAKGALTVTATLVTSCNPDTSSRWKLETTFANAAGAAKRVPKDASGIDGSIKQQSCARVNQR